MTKRKIEGSILRGEVELPSHVSFEYQPAASEPGGYREAAAPTQASLQVTYQHRSVLGRGSRQTSLSIEGETLSFTNRGRAQCISPAAIEQIFTTASPRKDRWALAARVAGRDYVLIDELPSPDHAQHVERLLEEFLQIEDDPDLDAPTRLAATPSRVLVDSSTLRVEQVESDSELAHLRVKSLGPAWSWALFAGLMLVHNSLFVGGLLFALRNPLVGLVGGFSVAVFWSLFFARALSNRSYLLVDDRTLTLQRGPILPSRVSPLALGDIRAIEVPRSNVKVNGSYRYSVVAVTADGDIKLFSHLPRKTAQSLGRILRKHLKEGRRSAAERERLRVRVANEVVEHDEATEDEREPSVGKLVRN